MVRTNCLFHALDTVKQHGGYICFSMSNKWEIQHAGNYDNLANEFSAFVPPAPLARPWHSIRGFEGSVVIGDHEPRRPMPPKIMWRGIMALVAGFWIWRTKRWVDSLRAKP